MARLMLRASSYDIRHTIGRYATILTWLRLAANAKWRSNNIQCVNEQPPNALCYNVTAVTTRLPYQPGDQLHTFKGRSLDSYSHPHSYDQHATYINC